MGEKINVLDIDIDGLSAKEAMQNCMAYLASAPVNVVEMVTADSMMRMGQEPAAKAMVKEFDMVLAGDKAILEAADVTERKSLREAEDRTFLKLFTRYLHKNHKRIYLLVETEDEGQAFYDFLERRYSGIQIVGMAKISAKKRADDMLVNAINGGETDCVLAALSAPLQEEFITKNRELLNTRVWMGLGKETVPVRRQGGVRKISHFVTKHILKKEMEKRRRNGQFLAGK